MSGHLVFTIQRRGHDLTKPHAPLSDYSDPKGPYLHIAQYLGWPAWVWAMETLPDFYNRWFRWTISDPEDEDLWILVVPEDVIRWMALDRQCENSGPVGEWIYPSPEAIRAVNEIPEALIPLPVSSAWLQCVLPAHKVLKANMEDNWWKEWDSENLMETMVKDIPSCIGVAIETT